MAKPISGNSGTVAFGTSILQVTGWTLSATSDNQSYVSSATGGHTRRVPGNKDWTASVTVLLDEGLDATQAGVGDLGDIASLVLATGTGVGIGGTYTGDGILDSVEIEDDIGGGALVSATLNFSADSDISSNKELIFAAN